MSSAATTASSPTATAASRRAGIGGLLDRLPTWGIGLGLVPTGLATLLMYRIVAACGVSFVAYSNYLVPVFALAFGALTLGEDLAFNVVAGLILILAGIAVSQLRRNRKRMAA